MTTIYSGSKAITLHDNHKKDITLDTSGNQDAFIAKYSDDGFAQWTTHISGIDPNFIYSITSNTSNNIYVTGNYTSQINIYDTDGNGHTTLGNSGQADTFIIKYSDTGYAQWATSISGVGYDYGNSIVTDTSNNIYVTGNYTAPINIYDTDNNIHTTLGNSGQADTFIVKYSDTGYAQWATHISGLGNDYGNSIVTDTANNIYVTGNYNAQISIYDTDGNGHTTLGNSGQADTFIVKYSDTGYAQWATHIAGSGDEYSKSITSDTLNNIYVTGSYTSQITIYDTDGNGHTTLGNSGNADAFIAKYSNTGYAQWATHISGSGLESIASIATDTANNIYVIGYYNAPINIYDTDTNIHTTLDSSGNTDVFIVKYSDTGYAQWATRISGSGDDYGTSIVTDTSNNIYVTGIYNAPITIYDTDGNGITLNNLQNIDTFVVKYSNTGYVQWATHISGLGNEFGSSIVTDTLNNIYVTGIYTEPITFHDTTINTGDIILNNILNDDAFVVKYSNTGYVQWATHISGLGYESGNSIISDTNNNIYVTGSYNTPIIIYNTNDDGHTIMYNTSAVSDVFIVKYNYIGYTQWATRISGVGGNVSYSITSNTSNNIYVTGNYTSQINIYDTDGNINTTLGNSGQADAFIVKYSDTGYTQWATRISGLGNDYGTSIVTDTSNNIYVTGYYTAQISIYNTNDDGYTSLANTALRDVFIVKYSDTGYCQWTTRISGSGNDYGSSIATDTENNIYVTGYYNAPISIYNTNDDGYTSLGNTSLTYDVFIVKYSDTGYTQWATRISGSLTEIGYSIVTDTNNNIYVIGTYNAPITLYNTNDDGHTTLNNTSLTSDIFIVKYNNIGYCQWATRISGSGDDYGTSIVTDTSNNIYVTGIYNAQITIYDTDGNGHTTLGNSGNHDAFIVKYSDTGYVQWATRISGSGDEYSNSITIDTLNNIYVTGGYNSQITFYNSLIGVPPVVPPITNVLTYLNYKKPSFSFSEQTSSSDRMKKLRNQTEYTFSKNAIVKNAKEKVVYNCNYLPSTYPSYQNQYDIIRGSVLCNSGTTG